FKKLEKAREEREEHNANPDNRDEPYDNTTINNLEEEFTELVGEEEDLNHKIGLIIAEIQELENEEEIICPACGKKVEELDEETDACKKCTSELNEGIVTEH